MEGRAHKRKMPPSGGLPPPGSGHQIHLQSRYVFNWKFSIQKNASAFYQLARARRADRSSFHSRVALLGAYSIGGLAPCSPLLFFFFSPKKQPFQLLFITHACPHSFLAMPSELKKCRCPTHPLPPPALREGKKIPEKVIHRFIHKKICTR